MSEREGREGDLVTDLAGSLSPVWLSLVFKRRSAGYRVKRKREYVRGDYFAVSMRLIEGAARFALFF